MTAAPHPRPHHAVWPKRLPRSLTVPQTSLWFNLEVSAARYAAKPAVLFFGRRFSWGDLHRQAEHLAGWLQQSAGVRKGDRVLLNLQNCPQFLVAFYAVLRADAVVVPVNPMNRVEELRHALADSGARVAIGAADLAPLLHQASDGLPPPQRLQHLLVTRYADALPAEGIEEEERPSPAVLDWLLADPPLPPGATPWADALGAGLVPGAHTAGPDDLAVLPYTSGTTGAPKGCLHPHRSLMANSIGGEWSFSNAETVALAVVPMFHITGLIHFATGAVYKGATSVLMPRWDRELAGRLIARHRITHWVCIPTMVIDLFASPNVQRFDLSSLKSMSGGGAAMPQAVAERLQHTFGITFCEGYGLTETAAQTHVNLPERAKLQCLGIPTFGTDSRIVDPVTLQELPPGEVGEIVSHGPQLFDGYWGHPQATAEAFITLEGQRFFRTGDLGRMDDEGYFFLTDRLKRMINASGFKVWPAEVEALLYQHPAVQEACIVAARDAYRGETVKAIVVLRAEARGTTAAEDITAWARDHMAAYKVPRVVEFADSLPKSGSGKVMWRLLQDRENRAA